MIRGYCRILQLLPTSRLQTGSLATITSMAHSMFAERRALPRLPAEHMLVRVRRKGRIGRIEGIAKDYNRHGIGLVLDKPIPKDTTVYISMASGGQRLENVIGVVHNCLAVDGGYRCGIQFRTTSHLQMDRCAIEQALTQLEQTFAAQA